MAVTTRRTPYALLRFCRRNQIASNSRCRSSSWMPGGRPARRTRRGRPPGDRRDDHALRGYPLRTGPAALRAAGRGHRTVADPQVRHRGTFGGALSHADPAGDLPAVALAFGTTMVVAGPAGRRTVPASEFFADYLQTALEPAEVLVSAVAMPVLKRFGPVLGGLAFGLVLGLLLGHRRRIVIMTAAAPGSYPPARTVL
jgi:hypothetical protein